MAIPTTNYGFLKPQSGETYDVATLDSNYDLIDSTIYNNLHKPYAADNILTLVNSGFAWTGGQSWDAGTLSVDTSSNASSQISTPQPTFATNGSLSGTVKFNIPGIFDVLWYNQPSGDPGDSKYQISTSGTWPTIGGGWDVFARDRRNSGYWECYTRAIGIRVPTAGLQVRLTGTQTNSTTNIANVRVILRSQF